jgi:hypothetical protein
MANVYIVPQPEGRPDYVSGPKNRTILYVGFSHVVTTEEAGDFEMWLPYVNGHAEKHHVRVLLASVEYDMNIAVPRKNWVYLQSPDGTKRIPLVSLGWQAGIYTHGEFINTSGSRGIIALNAAPVGLHIEVNYMLEMI